MTYGVGDLVGCSFGIGRQTQLRLSQVPDKPIVHLDGTSWHKVGASQEFLGHKSLPCFIRSVLRGPSQQAPPRTVHHPALPRAQPASPRRVSGCGGQDRLATSFRSLGSEDLGGGRRSRRRKAVKAAEGGHGGKEPCVESEWLKEQDHIHTKWSSLRPPQDHSHVQ